MNKYYHNVRGKDKPCPPSPRPAGNRTVLVALGPRVRIYVETYRILRKEVREIIKIGADPIFIISFISFGTASQRLFISSCYAPFGVSSEVNLTFVSPDVRSRCSDNLMFCCRFHSAV